MTVLVNILKDIAAQFAFTGGLFHRLFYVLAYYYFYGVQRLQGKNRQDGRLQALTQLVDSGLAARIVRIRTPGGMFMDVDVSTATFLVKEIVLDREYARLPQFQPRHGQTVVDIGGHQGVFSIEAAREVGPTGRVVAVEALPSNARLLKSNVVLNGLKNVEVVSVAVMDFSGPATLYVSHSSTGGNTLVFPDDRLQTISVEADTVDHILRNLGIDRVDLMKIDVEGACLQALKGAKAILAGKPRLVMEVEGGEVEIDKVCQYVESLGYRVERLASMLYAEAKTDIPA